MTTAFQFDDLNFTGSANKTENNSSARPSIVSLAGEMLSAGFVNPEHFLPTTMTDLFEGALCDDEIPSLLNFTPGMGYFGASEEVLQVNAAAQFASLNGFQQAEMPVPPAPETILSSQSQIQKRDLESSGPLPRISKGNKRIKRSTSAHNSNMLQDIRPLTELPSSAQVRGRSGIYNGVNTSTAHVKALTGANGAAVCLDAIEKALLDCETNGRCDTSTVSSLDSNGKLLSAEEKAKQNRDRNRQHARNTRVRKKAYVEELKRTLNQLVEERDCVVHQKRMEEQGMVDQRDVRFRVIADFLNLRGRNEPDPQRWSMILEDGFQLRLPRTDVPGVVCSSGGQVNGAPSNGSFPSYPLGSSKKVLSGVHEVMEDSKMVASLLQSLGASSLSVSYLCDKESFLMDHSSAVLNWMATSSGAMTKGASSEFSIEGSLRARFNPVSNKLLHMEFSF